MATVQAAPTAPHHLRLGDDGVASSNEGDVSNESGSEASLWSQAESPILPGVAGGSMDEDEESDEPITRPGSEGSGSGSDSSAEESPSSVRDRDVIVSKPVSTRPPASTLPDNVGEAFFENDNEKASEIGAKDNVHPAPPQRIVEVTEPPPPPPSTVAPKEEKQSQPSETMLTRARKWLPDPNRNWLNWFKPKDSSTTERSSEDEEAAEQSLFDALQAEVKAEYAWFDVDFGREHSGFKQSASSRGHTVSAAVKRKVLTCAKEIMDDVETQRWLQNDKGMETKRTDAFNDAFQGYMEVINAGARGGLSVLSKATEDGAGVRLTGALNDDDQEIKISAAFKEIKQVGVSDEDGKTQTPLHGTSPEALRRCVQDLTDDQRAELQEALNNIVKAKDSRESTEEVSLTSSNPRRGYRISTRRSRGSSSGSDSDRSSEGELKVDVESWGPKRRNDSSRSESESDSDEESEMEYEFKDVDYEALLRALDKGRDHELSGGSETSDVDRESGQG